jgi:hypothetical protein
MRKTCFLNAFDFVLAQYCESARHTPCLVELIRYLCQGSQNGERDFIISLNLESIKFWAIGGLGMMLTVIELLDPNSASFCSRKFSNTLILTYLESVNFPLHNGTKLLPFAKNLRGISRHWVHLAESLFPLSYKMSY